MLFLCSAWEVGLPHELQAWRRMCMATLKILSCMCAWWLLLEFWRNLVKHPECHVVQISIISFSDQKVCFTTWGFLSNDKNSVSCSVMICNLVEVCDCKLPLQCTWDVRCSGILCSVDCYLGTDLSGQPIGPNFKAQAVQHPWRWDR